MRTLLSALSLLVFGSAPALPLAPCWQIAPAAETGLVITVDMAPPTVVEGGDWVGVRCPGATPVQRVGAPELPVLTKLIAVPAGCTPRVVAVELDGRRRQRLERPVAPHRADIPKLLPPAPRPYRPDPSIYGRDASFPERRARIRECAELRGQRLAVLEVYPATYHPLTRELAWTTSMRVELDLGDAAHDPASARPRHSLNSPFADLLAEQCLGVESNRRVPPTADPDWPNPLPLVYLIVSADRFLPQAQALASWKKRKGFETHVTPISEIGSTPGDIIAFVTEAYQTWAAPPSYLLLFGDTDTLPADRGDTSLWGLFRHKTDLHYACVDGADYLPDLAYGRFPVRTTAQAEAMVQAIVAYESYGLAQSDWLNQSVFIGGEDSAHWQLAEETHRYVIENHTYPAGIDFTAIRGHFGGSTADISDAVDAGAMMVAYSGHGAANRWADPFFSQNHVRALTNAGELPLVLSFACDTGRYDRDECYGETWVLQGDTGGLCFYGASNSSLWDGDDILERRMFDVVFDTPHTTVGEMVLGGQLHLFHSGYGRSHYYYEMYNLMGDPSVDLWFGEPQPCEVSHPLSFSPGDQQITIEVEVEGEPAQGACVCVSREDDVFQVAETLDGACDFSFYAGPGEDLLVTVTAAGVAPYLGEIGAAEPRSPRSKKHR